MKYNLSINFKLLHNDQHFQLFGEFGDMVIDFDPETLKIQPQFVAWTVQFRIEEKVLKKITRSAYTDDIREADAKRDTAFRGLAGTCKIATTHFDEEVRAAARPLYIVFETYGNLTRKPMSEKTSAIFNLLQELRAHDDAAKTAGLEAWMSELASCNNLCSQLIKNRWDEAASQTSVSMKQARTDVEAAYTTVIERILALQIVEGGEIYDSFLRRLSVVIDTYNAAIAQRQSRSKNDDAAVEPKQDDI